MSKSREEKQAEAQENLAREQFAAAERERTAAREAERRITEVGRPTAAETARLGRYQERAVTPAETLMTQAGPISQAVARRIQERVETPGLEYQRDLPAYEAGVTQPLWRALKARGIAPPPGVEGGGLGTQQYMKGAEPALALLRAKQIGLDISRGQEYGAEAREYKGWYEKLEDMLSEALRKRQIAGVTKGVSYGVAGEEAYGERMIGGRETEVSYAAERAERQRQKRQQEAEMIGELVAMLATGGAAAPAVAARRMAGGGGVGGPITAPSLRLQEQTPYTRALAARRGGY